MIDQNIIIDWERVPKYLTDLYVSGVAKIAENASRCYAFYIATRMFFMYVLIGCLVMLCGSYLRVDIFTLAFINLVFGGSLIAVNQLLYVLYKNSLSTTINTHNETVKKIELYKKEIS